MRKQSNNSGVSGGYPPRSGYDELDTTLMPPRPGEAYNRGSPGPSAAGSMSGSQGGPPPVPFPVAPGQGGKTIYFFFSIFNSVKSPVSRKGYVQFLGSPDFVNFPDFRTGRYVR